MISPLPSRGLRGYASGVLAGGISAALFAVALMHADTVLVMVAYFAVVPLFTAGLGAGVGVGAIASMSGILALYLTKPLDFALFYAAAYALPAAVLIALALHRGKDEKGNLAWSTEGQLLTVVTLYPCIIFLAVVAAANSHDGGLLAMTKQVLNASTAQFKDAFNAETFKMLSTLMDQLARSLPSLLGCSWMFVILLSVVAAQGALKQQNWNLRPNFALQNIHIPTWMIFAAAATGLAGTFGQDPYRYIGANICVIMCVPFLLVGLAVVHGLAGSVKPLNAPDIMDKNISPAYLARKVFVKVAVLSLILAFFIIAMASVFALRSGATGAQIFILAVVVESLCFAFVWLFRASPKTSILTIFYIILTVLPWLSLAVAGLGVLDQWVNFRQRFAAGIKKGGKI